jgi:protein gp37
MFDHSERSTMADTTEISWTDSTFNSWIGCTKISEGCTNCYASDLNDRRGWTEWGPHGVRRLTADSTWNKPLKWQREAPAFQARTGHRQRVFCASLADVFDNRAPPGARERLWALIRDTPDLDWQLLTKRPENISKMLPPDWGTGYRNVWLGTTTEDQTAYDRRWSVLSRIPAARRFISYEPAIGPVRLIFGAKTAIDHPYPDWVIFGGESGPKARVVGDVRWATEMLLDCRNACVPFFLKQWGTWASNPGCQLGLPAQDVRRDDPDQHAKGGAGLAGHLYREFPASAAPMLLKDDPE